MSAYHCTPEHIGILVSWAAARGGNHEVRYYHNNQPHSVTADPARVFDLLGNENARSVAYRYREQQEPFNDRFRRIPGAMHADPRAIVNGCDCLEYQSCEHPEWRDSEAYKALHAIREAAISHLCAGCEVWNLDRTNMMRSKPAHTTA